MPWAGRRRAWQPRCDVTKKIVLRANSSLARCIGTCRVVVCGAKIIYEVDIICGIKLNYHF